MFKSESNAKAAHAGKALHAKSPYFKVLCVVMSILLVLLLVPSAAMSTVRTWADEVFPPAEEQQTTEEVVSDAPSADVPEVTEEVKATADNQEAVTNDTNAEPKSVKLIYNADGTVTEAGEDYVANSDVTYDYSEFGEGSQIFTSATTPTWYYKPPMDLDFRGYITSPDKDDNSFIHYTTDKTDPLQSAFRTVYGSQGGANGNYIRLCPNTQITKLVLTVHARTVDEAKTLFPHVYLNSTLSITNPIWQNETADPASYIDDLDTEYILTIDLTGKALQPNKEYFIFANVHNDDASGSLNSKYGAIFYNKIEAEYSGTSFVANIQPTTTVAEATALVTDGQEGPEHNFSATVTTSTFNSSRIVVKNIPEGFTATSVTISANNYTTIDKEAHTFSECWDVGDVYLKMDSLKITGTLKKATTSTQEQDLNMYFAYYEHDGTVKTVTKSVKVDLDRADYDFEFDQLIGGQEGIFGITYAGFAGFAGYAPATTEDINISEPIQLVVGNTAKFTYDTNTVKVTADFYYLNSTSAWKTFDVPSGISIPTQNDGGEFANLPIKVSAFGQYDVVKNTYKTAAGKTTTVTVPLNTPYKLPSEAVEANLKLESPVYSWMVKEDDGSVTYLNDGDSYKFTDTSVVSCTGSTVIFEQGQRIEITESRVATLKIIQSPTADADGIYQWSVSFTKVGFSDQSIKVYYPKTGEAHTHIVDGQERTFTAWTSDTSLPSPTNSTPVYYYLTQDVYFTSKRITLENKQVNICLNGHAIYLNGQDSSSNGMYNLTSGSSLSIFDDHAGESTFRHYFDVPNTNTNLWVRNVTSTTSHYIDGGVITGSSGSNQLISMARGTTLKVYGGTFVGNYTSGQGSVVNASGGTITFDGSHERTSAVVATHSSVSSEYPINIVGNNQEGVSSGGGGGAFYLNAPVINLTGCSFIENRTVGNRGNRNNGSGAVYFTTVNGTDGSSVFTNVDFYKNFGPGKGGAMFVQGGGSGTKTIDFKNVNMSENGCGSYNGTLDGHDSRVTEAWGGGVALSTNSWVTHLRLDGFINVTDNYNFCYSRQLGKIASTDNISLERKGSTSTEDRQHSLIYFKEGFDMQNSQIGVNTFCWDDNQRYNEAFVGRVTDGGENYYSEVDPSKKLISIFQEDTVLEETQTGDQGYTIATRVTQVGDQLKHELFLVPHNHKIQYSLLNDPSISRPTGLYNTLKVSCEEENEGFEYHMGTSSKLYDPELRYQDNYKCKYQESPLQMTAKGENVTYDGNEHPIEMLNFSEMYQQELVGDLKYQYYRCEYDGELDDPITGVPVDAGTYCCQVTVPLLKAKEGEAKTAVLTSLPYTIEPRGVIAYIIGKNRTFNGSGKLTDVASSYLYNTEYSSAAIVPGDDVSLGYSDTNHYSILSSYGSQSTIGHKYKYNEYVTQKDGVFDKPITVNDGEEYNVGYELVGNAAKNYKIIKYEGMQHILPFEHNPKFRNKTMSIKASATLNYSCTYNWFDGKIASLPNEGAWYYKNYIGYQTGDTVIEAPLTKLTYKYVKLNEDKTDVVNVSEVDQYLDTTLDNSDEGYKPPSGQGPRINSNVKTGSTYLQTIWEKLDINEDGTPEYAGGDSPHKDETTGTWSGGWIQIDVTDSNMPGLTAEIFVENQKGENIDKTEVHLGDTLYYWFRITNNGGTVATKNGIKAYSDLFDGGVVEINDLAPGASYESPKGEGRYTYTVTEDDLNTDITYDVQATTQWNSAGTTLDITSNKPQVTNHVAFGEVSVNVQSYYYNGQERDVASPIEGLDGIQSVTGDTKKTDVKRNEAGDVQPYSVVVTLKPGWQWAGEGQSEPKSLSWYIYPRDLTVSPEGLAVTYDKNSHSLTNIASILETTAQTQEPKVTVTSGAGTDTILLSTGDTIKPATWSDNNSRTNQGEDNVSIKTFNVLDGKGVNYNLTSSTAVLKVETRQITATINGHTKTGENAVTYTGSEIQVLGFDVVVTSGDETYYDTAAETFFSQRDTLVVAKGTNVKANYETDFYFEDITGSSWIYNDKATHEGDYINVACTYTVNNGALQINPVGLDDERLIKAVGKDFVYDDKAYSLDGNVTVTYTPEGGAPITLTTNDYTIADNKQTEANTSATPKYTTRITGKGNYTNYVDVDWHITPKPLTIAMDSQTKVYDGKSVSLTPTITGLVDQTKETPAGTIKHELTIDTYKFTNVSGVEISANSQTDVGENTVTPETYSIKQVAGGSAAVKASNYAPTITNGTIKITPLDVSAWTVINAKTVYNAQEQDAFTINGKEQTALPNDPDLRAKVVGTVGDTANYNLLEKDTDFEVRTGEIEGVEYDNNVQTNAGTYTIYVQGKRNFTGHRTITYEISTAHVAVWGSLVVKSESIVGGDECKLDYLDNTSEYGSLRVMTYVKNPETGLYDVAQSKLLSSDQHITGNFSTHEATNIPPDPPAPETEHPTVDPDANKTDIGYYCDTDRYYHFIKQHEWEQPAIEKPVGTLDKEWRVYSGQESNVDETSNYNFGYDVKWVNQEYQGETHIVPQGGVAVRIAANNQLELNLSYIGKTKVYDGTELSVSMHANEEVTQAQPSKEAWSMNFSQVFTTYAQYITVKYTPVNGECSANQVRTGTNAKRVSLPDSSVSIPAYTEGQDTTFTFGDFTITINKQVAQDVANGTFKISQGTGSLQATVTPRELTVIPDKDGSSSIVAEYDGNAHNFSAVKATGLISYQSEEHVVSSSTFNNNRGIDVADSTNNVTVQSLKVMGKDESSPSVEYDATGNYTLKKSPGKITITPYDFSIGAIKLSATNLTYNGENQTTPVKVEGELGGAVRTLAVNTDFVYNYPETENFTQHEVKDGYDPSIDPDQQDSGYNIKITGQGNYSGILTTHWNIIPREVELTTGDVEFTYDGNKHMVTDALTDSTTHTGNNGLVTGHTAVASGGFTPDSAGKPADGIINVSDSPVKYTANGFVVTSGGTTIASKNYKATLMPGTLTIKPVEFDENFTLTASGFVYNGAVTKLADTLDQGEDGGTLVLVWNKQAAPLTLGTDYVIDETTGDYSAKDVKTDGTYTITVKGVEGGNFSATSSKSAAWNVRPAKATVWPVSNTEAFEFEKGKKWTLTDARTEGLVDDETVYSTSGAQVTFTYPGGGTDGIENAGTYTVSVKSVNGLYKQDRTTTTPTTNYSWTFGTGTLKIDPYDIGVEGHLDSAPIKFTYNKQLQTVTRSVVLNVGMPTVKWLPDGPTYQLQSENEFRLIAGEESEHVSYAEVNANGEGESYFYKIEGLGNYTGKKVIPWYILKANLTITVTPASGTFQFAGYQEDGETPINHTVTGSTYEATDGDTGVYDPLYVTHKQEDKEEWQHGDVTDSADPLTTNGEPTKWTDLEGGENLNNYFSYADANNVTVTWAPGVGKIIIYPKSFIPDPPVPEHEDDDSGFIDVFINDIYYDGNTHGADTSTLRVEHFYVNEQGDRYNVSVLKAGQDYTVDASDEHKDVGTYTLTVTGAGNYRDARGGNAWAILPIDLDITINGEIDTTEHIYDAKPHYVDGFTPVIKAAYTHDTRTSIDVSTLNSTVILGDWTTTGDFKLAVQAAHTEDARAGGTDVNWTADKTQVIPYHTDMNKDWFNATPNSHQSGTITYYNTPRVDMFNGTPWEITITPKDPGNDPFEVHWSSGYTDGFTYDFVEYQIKDEWLTVTDTTLTSESEPQGHVLKPNDFEIVPYNDSSLEGDEQSWPKAKEAKELTGVKGVKRITGDDGNLYTIIIRGQQGSNYANIQMMQWVDPGDQTQGMEKLQTEWGIHRRPIDNASSIEGMHNDTYIALKNPVLRYTGEALTQEIDNVTMNSWHGGQWGPDEPVFNFFNLFGASNDDPVREAINEDTDYTYPRSQQTEPGVYYLSIEGKDNFKNSVNRPYVIIDEEDPGKGDSNLSFGVRVFDDQYAPTEVTNQGVDGWDAIMMTAYVDDLSDMYAVTDPQTGDGGQGWLEIYLDIKDAMQTILPDIRGEFEKVMARDGMDLFQYIDVDVNSELYLQRVGETERSLERLREIHELNHEGDTLDITMNVPQAMQDYAVSLNNPNAFKIYREHDGVVSDLQYTYDMEAGTVSFTSDKFSNFCIAYNPTAENNNSGAAQTGDNPWMLYAFIGFVCLALCAAYVAYRRKNSMQNSIYPGKHVR